MVDSYKTRFAYDGPVFEFDRLLVAKWHGETFAKTPAQAKNQLTYQFKQQTNRAANTKITLKGNVRSI